MRVLIADDDSAFRTALRLVLEGEGHEVLETDCPAELVSALQGGAPDIVLVDAGLAGSGLSVWQGLDRRPEYRGRALLMTGNLPALGALGGHPSVLAKPFDYGALVARISGVGPRAATGEPSAAGTTSPLASPSQ